MSTHRAAGAARTTVRAAGRHPGETLSLVGVGALAATVVGMVVAIRVVRSRRVRRGVVGSARRGAFGPGPAVAAAVADRVHEHRASA